jgi:hypothetical protein
VWTTIRNLVIAVLIIGAGAGGGWLIATLTNPYPANNTLAAATVTAAPRGTAAASTGQTPPSGQTPASTPSGTQTGTGPAQGTAPTSVASGQTPGATTVAQNPNAAGGTPGANRLQAAQITGKIEKYDTTAKTLTVATEQGSRTLNIGTARYQKTLPFKTEEFSSFASSPLIVAGERGADGAINARSITATELPTTGGGQGQGQQFGGGGQGAGAGRPGGAGQATILISSSFKDGVLTGQTFQGEAVKVNVTANTSLLKQTAATETDLKPGATITATVRPNSGDTPETLTVVINS